MCIRSHDEDDDNSRSNFHIVWRLSCQLKHDRTVQAVVKQVHYAKVVKAVPRPHSTDPQRSSYYHYTNAFKCYPFLYSSYKCLSLPLHNLYDTELPLAGNT